MQVSVPSTLKEALEELAAHPDTVPVAGGTDLLVAINFGRARPERVMSIRKLEELQEVEADGQVFCGAGVTYTRIPFRNAGNGDPGSVVASSTSTLNPPVSSVHPNPNGPSLPASRVSYTRLTVTGMPAGSAPRK